MYCHLSFRRVFVLFACCLALLVGSTLLIVPNASAQSQFDYANNSGQTASQWWQNKNQWRTANTQWQNNNWRNNPVSQNATSWQSNSQAQATTTTTAQAQNNYDTSSGQNYAKPAQASWQRPNNTVGVPTEWPGGTAPHADAPKCAQHDPNQWHGLWNPTAGCYYDHEHKDNPGILYTGMPSAERAQAEKLIELFGAPGAWFGGNSISYPWQTFMGAGDHYNDPAPDAHLENTHKHEGYGWIARTDIAPNGKHWVKDFRIQYHAVFANVGAVTRYHSFSLEANICERNGACSIMRTGGHMDFGHLKVFGGIVQLPGQEGDGARQRLHREYKYPEFAVNPNFKTSAVWYGLFTRNDHVKEAWSLDAAYRPIRKLTLVIESQDIWSNINTDDLKATDLFCPEFDCDKNNSTFKMHRMEISLVSDEPFSGYTDRFGLANPECDSPSLDCIPTTIEPFGRVNINYRDHRMREFDVSPPGTYWIEYPN